MKVGKTEDSSLLVYWLHSEGGMLVVRKASFLICFSVPIHYFSFVNKAGSNPNNQNRKRIHRKYGQCFRFVTRPVQFSANDEKSSVIDKRHTPPLTMDVFLILQFDDKFKFDLPTTYSV